MTLRHDPYSQDNALRCKHCGDIVLQWNIRISRLIALIQYQARVSGLVLYSVGLRGDL